MLPEITPIAPTRLSEPFDHNEWVFEPKLDAFRALAYVQDGVCTLVCRRLHVYRAFGLLPTSIAAAVGGREAIVDGEIVCLNTAGEPQFSALLFRRDQPWFYAFDLLWLDGEDMRGLPLLERKLRLRHLVPRGPSRLLYVEHTDQRGRDLFRVICERDLEGIVGKVAHAPVRGAAVYLDQGAEPHLFAERGAA